MARTQPNPDLPIQATRVGRSGLRWGIIGLLAMVLALVLLGYASNSRQQQLEARAAVASLSAQLFAAPTRVATDPSGLLSDLQSAQAQMDASNQAVPENARTALSQVATQATGLASESQVLRNLGDQSRQFDQALADVSTSTRALRARPKLIGDRWGQALSTALTELSRPELASMPAVFAPTASNQGVQKQWATRFAQVAATLNRLPPVARRDATLDDTDRQTLEAWVDAAQRLSTSTQALSAQAPLRERAATASRTVAAAVGSSAEGLRTTPIAPWLSTLTLVGWILAGLSLASWLLVLRAIGKARTLALDVSEESRESVRQVDAIDRLMRQIQKVAPSDGPVQASVQIEEAPNSPFFPIATGFNRLVDALLQHQRRIRDQSNEADYALAPLLDSINELSALQQRLRHGADALEQSGLAGATQAAVVAQRLSQLFQEVKTIQESLWRTAAMLQERGFRMDALRESNQDIAKRIKRLGESSQGIGLAADRTHTISQQLKVVAINIAIEAASAGPAGQPFTSMAQEVQRLSLSGAEQAQELYALVELLLGDASEVGSTMEAATTEVVESGRLSEQTENSVRDVERLAQPLAGELQRLVGELEAQALALDEATKRQIRANAETGQAQSMSARIAEGMADLRLRVRGLGRDGE